MKKTLLLLLLLCCSLLAHSQDNLEFSYNGQLHNLPVKDGSAYFSEVYESEFNAEYLYTNAKLAISDIFKSAQDVIQVDDPAAKIIVAKGYADWIKNKDAMVSAALKIYFTLKIECRDGRYKVSIYDFISNTGSTYSLDLTLNECKAYGFKRNSNVLKNNFYGYSLPAWLETGNNILNTVSKQMEKAEQDSSEDNW